MTKDELIALAKEAESVPAEKDVRVVILTENELERFANLVAAKEREECADIAESFIVDNDFGERGGNEVASGIYDAIRARKP